MLTKTVPNTIQALMRHRGYKDREMAERSGIERATFNTYKNARRKFGLDELEAIAKALDVPASVLLMQEEEAVRWVLDHAPNSKCAPWDSNPEPADSALALAAA